MRSWVGWMLSAVSTLRTALAQRGGTFVDISATRNGQTVRIQTVDTDRFGNPTPSEAAAAARIRAQFPNDLLELVPKQQR